MRKVLVVLTLVGSVACSGNDKAGSSGSSTTGGGTSGSSGSSGSTGGTTASCRDGHQVSHYDAGQCGDAYPDLALAQRIVKVLPGGNFPATPHGPIPDGGVIPLGTYVLTSDEIYGTSDINQAITVQAAVKVLQGAGVLVVEDIDCRELQTGLAVLLPQGQGACASGNNVICAFPSCGDSTVFSGASDYELLDGGGFRLYNNPDITTWLPAP